jgi:pSer/pThr/pTyr-binding forkhead associated (FHA) protein
LLKYASEENYLRQRVRRKAQISSVETAPVSSWQLRAEIANGESALFEVIETYSTTGRADECELVLPLPHISRKHAVLMPRAGGLGVRDLNSSNGTYVNGVLMQYAILHEGDILTIGWQDFVVEYCGPAEGILIA